MGCGSCNNRRGLFKRTIQNVVRTIENNKTSKVTVTPSSRECNIKVVLKSTGYVAQCSTHGTSGKPATVPDQAKVECNESKSK
jgi:ribosomal protein S8